MPLTPSGTRDLLAQLGHLPKKFLGQNFLVDGNIVRKSVELAEVDSGDAVVEIGPGLGTLTVALLETGASVWAVEKDRNLFEHLNDTLAPLHLEKLHLIEGDAVELPLAGIPEARGQEGYKIVANLPYAVSTPWMDAVLSGPCLPTRMVLMLQQEAAQRYIARPGTKQFSAVSIFVQAAFDVAPGHKVSARCFYPQPEIESFLLHLVRKSQPHTFSPEHRSLIRGLFQQRRKQLGSLLRQKLGEATTAKWLDILGAAGFDGRSRPEDIPPLVWQELSRA